MMFVFGDMRAGLGVGFIAGLLVAAMIVSVTDLMFYDA